MWWVGWWAGATRMRRRRRRLGHALELALELVKDAVGSVVTVTAKAAKQTWIYQNMQPRRNHYYQLSHKNLDGLPSAINYVITFERTQELLSEKVKRTHLRLKVVLSVIIFHTIFTHTKAHIVTCKYTMYTQVGGMNDSLLVPLERIKERAKAGVVTTEATSMHSQILQLA